MTRHGNNNLVFAAILFVLGGAGVGVGVWGLSVAWGTRDWVEVRAEVIDVEQETYTYTHQRGSGGSFEEEGQRLRCRFAFRVGGDRYESDRYSLLEHWDEYTTGEASLRELDERLALLSTGSVPAYYDPEDPSEAVLLLPETVPPTLLLSAGLVLLGLCLRNILSWRKAQRTA